MDDDRWGPDPIASSARRLWHRVRIPLGVLVLVVMGVHQRHLLLSGHLFPVLTWAMQMCFWAFLFFVATRGTAPADPTDAPAMRAWSRSQLLAWSVWLVVGAAWLVAASGLYGWESRRALILLWPTAMILLSAPGYWGAEALAARVRRAQAARGGLD